MKVPARYDGDCFVFAVKLSAVCSSSRSSGIALTPFIQLGALAHCGAHKVYVFYSPVFDLHVPLRVDHLIRRRVVVEILECGDHLLETCEGRFPHKHHIDDHQPSTGVQVGEVSYLALGCREGCMEVMVEQSVDLRIREILRPGKNLIVVGTYRRERLASATALKIKTDSDTGSV